MATDRPALRWGATLLAGLVLAWLALCLFLFLVQRKLIYFPEFTRTESGGTDYVLDRDGTVLRGWVVNPDKASAILYFGGNADRIQVHREAFARWFPERTVYLVAYRGYGASDGVPTGEALLADAVALFDDVQARHPGQPVSVIGRSLGSGIASYLASRRAVDRLALVTPFDSLAGVAALHYPWLPARWLIRDRYPSDQWLQTHAGTVLVIRARDDTIVPPASTDALVAALPRPATVVEIANAGHNDIDADPRFGQALSDFMR